jgi:hypothetical protein
MRLMDNALLAMNGELGCAHARSLRLVKTDATSAQPIMANQTPKGCSNRAAHNCAHACAQLCGLSRDGVYRAPAGQGDALIERRREPSRARTNESKRRNPARLTQIPCCSP